MTKTEIMQLSQGLSNLYSGLETDLMANIAEYLARQDLDMPTAQWKMQLLAELGALDKENIKTIAQYAGIAPDMLQEALEISALDAIKELEPGFQLLAKDGIINGTHVPVESTVASALKTYNKQARNSLNLVNTVMKYKSKDIAVRLINEIANKQEKLDMLNKATGKTVLGIESRQQAMRQCIKEMSEKGIPAFVDKLGREWSPEAYINMDIRTTCNNVAHQSQFDRMDDYGIDLVEVSSHSGARPKCAKDQGRIFDRSNKSKKYPHWKTSSYGEPDGLLGINCGHHIYPFVPGVSYQTYFPAENSEENDKHYQELQKQRELERRVRKSKRECMMLDKVGDKEGLQKASITLKQRQQALQKYCKDKGLSYKSDRTAVVGYNKSVAGSVAANNHIHMGNIKGKPVDNKNNMSIIKVKDFNETEEYLKRKYDIVLDSSVKKLDFTTCKSVLTGVEDVFSQYPDLPKNITRITTDKSGVMCCNGTEIKFNPLYFRDTNLKNICKQQSESGFWISNSSPASIGAHETAHAIEQLLIDANKNYEYSVQKISAWNECTEANYIVSQACKNIKNVPEGKGKKKADLINGISKYASSNASETLAESFADVYANGDNAQPLSKEVVKLTKEKYELYLKEGRP